MYGRDRNCFSGRGGDDAVGTLASLETMFSVERRHRCRDYLSSSESSSFISPDDRRKMVNWMYRVIDVSNKLPRDIVIAAMTIVDRFVSLEDKQEFLRERSKYQLLIMVSIARRQRTRHPSAGVNMTFIPTLTDIALLTIPFRLRSTSHSRQSVRALRSTAMPCRSYRMANTRRRRSKRWRWSS